MIYFKDLNGGVGQTVSMPTKGDIIVITKEEYLVLLKELEEQEVNEWFI